MKGRLWQGVVLAVSGSVAATLYGQAKGLAGFGLGLFGGAFGTFVLAWTIRLMAANSSTGKPGVGVGFLLLMAVAKLPLLLFLAGWTRQIGAAAFDCFLGGVILVYFAVVIGAAIGGSEDETPASHGPSTG